MDEEFTIASNDPLVELGLVDPGTGKPVPTTDWQPKAAPTSAGSADSQDAQGRGAPTGDVEDSSPDVSPRPAPPEAPANQWDSEENPYKKQLEAVEAQQREAQLLTPEKARAQIQEFESRLKASIPAAIQQLMAQGMNGQPLDQHTATAIIEAQAQALKAQAEKSIMEMTLAPSARLLAATELAKKYSTPAAPIKPEELLTEENPYGMEARAKTLQEARRNSNFQARKADRRDTTEGGSQVSKVAAEAIEKLSPGKTIALGLARGD